MKRALVVVVGVMFGCAAMSADPPPAAAPVAVPAAPAALGLPEKVVAYRKAEMSIIAKHMKTASLIASGDIGRPQDLLRHAEGLHAESMDLLALFPEGTGPDKIKTEAKAEIWSKHADFEAAVTKLQTESAKLVEVAKTGDLDASKAQLDKVGDSCGSCHDAFKLKD